MKCQSQDIAAIPGATPPVKNNEPVSIITATEQYTGTIAWSPVHNNFWPETIYAATITLTAKTGYTLKGVSENFFTVAEATTVSNAADSGVVTAVFPETGQIAVSDYYQGGIIAYIFTDADGLVIPAGETHGLIAAMEDLSEQKQWSNITNTALGGDGTETGIGYGGDNTTAIVNQTDCDSVAAYECYYLVKNGYDDWFLPSIDELNKLYENRYDINARANSLFVTTYDNSFYWSSSENWQSSAWSQRFDSGDEANSPKDSTSYVRPVRYFRPEE